MFGLFRYFQQPGQEIRDKQNARFEEIVRGLGGDREQQQVSSALLLPTFLDSRYKRFYAQVFNLAAGNLRSSALSAASDSKDHSRNEPNQSSPNPLKQALANVLRESYPLARKRVVHPGLVALVRQRLTPQDERDERNERQKIDSDLNATGVNLDGAFLAGADLRMGSWREALFREARLRAVDLSSAVLEGADFSRAEMNAAVLSGANLADATFTEADLEEADLSGCELVNADFRDAKLSKVNMVGGIAGGIDLSGADLTQARFCDVEFDPIPPNVERANLHSAKRLSGAVFEDAGGLTEHQVGLCEEMGAVFRSRASRSESAPVDNAAQVSTTSPLDRSEGVPPDILVTTIFSTDMYPTTLNTTTFKLVEKPTNTPVAGRVVYDASNKKATFTPEEQLASATTYQATITTDVQDQAGNALAEDHTWQWKTA